MSTGKVGRCFITMVLTNWDFTVYWVIERYSSDQIKTWRVSGGDVKKYKKEATEKEKKLKKKNI